MAKKKRLGQPFGLLLYERRMHGYRRTAMLFALVLLGLWFVVINGFLEWFPDSIAPWLLIGCLVALGFSIFAWMAPNFTYVHPRQDHLRLQTPFFRLKIPYREINTIRSINFGKMFPPASLRGRDRWLLSPFMLSTALAIDMQDWPARPGLLRFFLGRYFLATDQTALLFLVRDWMSLSNQITTLMDTWRARGRKRPRGPGFSAAEILRDDRE